MAIPSALTPSPDTSYPRRLLEWQPACLVRVRLDGVLLACNDAALRLFGIGALREVLNTNLTDRIVPAQRARWHEFTTQCWADGAASFECDLVIVDNRTRPVLVQGVALEDHPDGVESLLVHLFDQSRTRLQAATVDQARLRALVDEGEVDRKRLTADHHAAVDALEQSLARTVEEAALNRGQFRQALDKLRSQLAQASAQQDRLAAQIEEHERARACLVADHHRALAEMDTGKREALAELRSQLAESFANQRRLAAWVEEHERERDSVIAQHHRALVEMETGKREALAELRSQLSQAFADERRLAARVDDQELERDRLRAEHYLVLTDLENRNRGALAELRSELSQAAAAEHSRLIALLEDHDRERERMAAEHRRALTDLQVSKCEVVAECERVLTEVQRALLVRDGPRLLEIEHCLIDGIDEGTRKKADGERFASLVQDGLTQALTEVEAVLKNEKAEPVQAELDELKGPTVETIDVDPLHDLFDDADDAFVRDLLEGRREPKP